MEKSKIKYLNPITVEAEIFHNSLESLLKTSNTIDSVLISSLEKIMSSIGKLLDSAPIEVVETKSVKLVKLNNVSQIKRIFSCTVCNRDIGKSIEKLALHLTDKNCNVKNPCSDVSDIVETKTEPKVPHKKQQKITLKELGVKQEKKKAEQKLDQTKLNKKTLALLTTNLSKFFEDQVTNGTKIKFKPAYNYIEKDLLDLIKPLFPNEEVKVYKFGSRIAGIGHQNSDLDLYIDIGNTFNIFQNRADTKSVLKLKKVKKALTNNSKWMGLLAIEKARVPLLKVMHNTTGIECDINFSNSLGVINTQLLEYIINLQPIALLLCCFMKKWLLRTKLSIEINTYSMSLMVVFYLQTLNIIPSIKRLQESITDEKVSKVGYWITNFTSLSNEELNLPLVHLDEQNLLKYVRSFFLFCINFNYDQDVICPYLGKIVKRREMDKLMPSRYKKINILPGFELQLDKPIVVQDPIQLNHNTTKSVDQRFLKYLKSQMTASLKTLNDIYLEDV